MAAFRTVNHAMSDFKSNSNPAVGAGGRSGRRFFRVPRMAAHTAVTAGYDAVADDDALDGDVLARAAFGALVIDTSSAVRQKVSHFSYRDRCPRTGECGRPGSRA